MARVRYINDNHFNFEVFLHFGGIWSTVRRDAKMTCQALKIQKVPKQMSHFLNKNLIEYFGNEPYHYAPNKTSKLYIPSTIKHLKEATQHIYLGK